MLTTHRNDFHNKNIYIDFENEDISSMLSFRAIADKFDAPLQIMLEDKGDLKRNFILQNGFKLMRTCYSCEFSSLDLKITPSDTKIITTVKNHEFCWNYYNYYKKMHQAINPLTASFEEFVEILPNEVYFVDEKNFAFVEDNEIAYVLCEETSTGDDFLLDLCHALFCKYGTIVFEADDVDPIAMRLKNKFVNGFVEKTETWIYK